MNEVKRIYIAWREGDQRKLFASIDKGGKDACLRYILSDQEMRVQGIRPLVDFPCGKEYTKNVLDILSLRLNDPTRPDMEKYYRFWEIPAEKRTDTFYLLAHTQGLLATDNYEFLAEYELTKDLRFISEICGLSQTNIKAEAISIGEKLRWEREPNNGYDPYAAAIYAGDLKLGYVKAVHNRVFATEKANGLNVRVKSIEANGHLGRVFVSIGF